MAAKKIGSAFAPSNIALIKYWGKRESTLNLPLTSSLSISLGHLGTQTEISEISESSDQVFLNRQPILSHSAFYQRIQKFLDLTRPNTRYLIHTHSNIPIAAGLASSASGFAALTLALNDLYSWNLSIRELSILARQGSGSACRSIESGFVEWLKGEDPAGSDSYGMKLPLEWPEFSIGLVLLSTQEKPISSRLAMQRTRETSVLYHSWPKQVEQDLAQIKPALFAKDFETVGRIAEHNALSMHATMLAASPAILYSLPQTLEIYQKIWRLRSEGIPVYFTQDAGPNVKILCLKSAIPLVTQAFPEAIWVRPFSESKI